MTIQIISLKYPDIFKRYSEKYNIFRDLHEVDLCGLEIRDINRPFSKQLRDIVLGSKEICYNYENDNKLNDFLVIGTITIFKDLAKRILSAGNEDIGYKISSTIENYANHHKLSFEIGDKKYSAERSYIMGIVNVTPDSFSDGGENFSREKAYEKAASLIDEGADIIDIGGESTRPGAKSVSVDEEINRVIPVIERLVKNYPNAVISVDTRKSEVAKRACDLGTRIVNDISGLTYDPDMAAVIAKYKSTLVLMHIQGNPDNMQKNPYYKDVVNEIYNFLTMQIKIARKAGIKNIIVDPGIGFGKRIYDNYEIIKRLEEFKGLGFPILIGLSRKSFIGKVFNLNVNEREDTTLAAETVAITKGANIIRTHFISNTIQASKMIYHVNNPDKILNV